jgi:hypothetical protein
MNDRVYISTISPAWTVHRQREMLAAVLAGPHTPVYEDAVSVRARKAHRGTDLEERGQMLRPSGRQASGEVIHVASLSALAWDPADLVVVLAAAAGRRATVRVHDIGMVIPPADAMALADAAVQAFIESRRNAQTEPGRLLGNKVAAANKRAGTAAKIAMIRDDWPLRAVKTTDLLMRAGITYVTAAAHLGSRPRAQAAYERKVARKAAKESKNG